MSESASPDSAFPAGRVTPQRRAITETAAAMTGAFTVEELLTAVRERESATATATVYRAVAAMEASGWLERVGQRGASALFARCAAEGDHHHHLVCDGCGRVTATRCPLFESPTAPDSGSQLDGFLVTRHEVTLYGLCQDCRRTDG